MHLWEVKHSYYCSESNFYSSEPYNRYGSWPEFVSGMGAADLDMNLVFRWDWTEGDDEASNFNGDPYYRNGTLQLFYMVQRKGIFSCHEVSVCRADEPAVIAFLKPRWEHMRALWEPVSQPTLESV